MVDTNRDNGQYILICNDVPSFDEKRIDGFDIAEARLRKGVWPMYKSTSHRKRIGPGASCLVYVAGYGKHKGHFIGMAKVDRVENIRARDWVEPSEDAVTDLPTNVIFFSEVEHWVPLNIRPLVEGLQFITTKDKWGVHMQGGCKAMVQVDFNFLTSKRISA